MRHCTFGIEFRCLLKSTDSRVVIEAVKKSEALVKVALGFGRVSRDFARVRAEPIIERFFRCKQIEAGQCQHRPDNDLEDFGPRFHRWSCQSIRRISSGKLPV